MDACAAIRFGNEGGPFAEAVDEAAYAGRGEYATEEVLADKALGSGIAEQEHLWRCSGILHGAREAFYVQNRTPFAYVAFTGAQLYLGTAHEQHSLTLGHSRCVGNETCLHSGRCRPVEHISEGGRAVADEAVGHRGKGKNLHHGPVVALRDRKTHTLEGPQSQTGEYRAGVHGKAAFPAIHSVPDGESVRRNRGNNPCAALPVAFAPALFGTGAGSEKEHRWQQNEGHNSSHNSQR